MKPGFIFWLHLGVPNFPMAKHSLPASMPGKGRRLWGCRPAQDRSSLTIAQNLKRQSINIQMVKQRQHDQSLILKVKRGDFCQYLAYKLCCRNPPPFQPDCFNLQGNMKMYYSDRCAKTTWHP